MAIRCPRCSTPPPVDPFVCTACGDHLLTYVGEPFGPGTGVPGPPASAPAGMAPPGGPIPSGPYAPGGPYPPPYQPGYPVVPPQPQQPTAPRRSDGIGSFIAKVLLGLFVAMCLVLWEPVAGLLLLGLLALMLWRWKRAPVFLFFLALVGAAVAAGILAEIIDEIDFTPGSYDYEATPEIVANTPVAVAFETPTLVPVARTATATVIAGEQRQRMARARARWLRGDNAAALVELDQAVRVQPEATDILNLRALVRVSAGNLQGAAEDADKAVTIQPSAATYHDTQGYVFLKQGRYAEAREAYNDALGTLRGAGRAASLLGRGLAQSALGNLTAARSDLDQGLALAADSDPDPQLADLEAAGRRALDPLAPRGGSPSPAASPGAEPGLATTPVPVRSPATTPSPAALLHPDPPGLPENLAVDTWDRGRDASVALDASRREQPGWAS